MTDVLLVCFLALVDETVCCCPMVEASPVVQKCRAESVARLLGGVPGPARHQRPGVGSGDARLDCIPGGENCSA